MKRIFTLRNLMRAIFGIVALITAYAIFCVEERWRGERLWNDYRTKALARGEKLDFKDFIPPEIPDSENFAAIPMVQDLFKADEEQRPRPDWFAALKLSEISWKSSESALETYSAGFVKQKVVPKGETAADTVLAALKLVEPELEQLREAARRPKARFPVHWERNVSANLSHLTSWTNAARLHRIAISANLAKGNTQAALEHFHDGVRMYELLRDEPSLVSGLVRLSTLRNAEEPVVADGALFKWTQEDLNQIEVALGRIDLAHDGNFALATERASFNEIISSLVDAPHAQVNEFMRLAWRIQFRFYPRGWFRLSQVKLNEHYDAMQTLEAVEHGAPVETVQPESWDHPKSDPLSPLLIYRLAAPIYSNIHAKYLEAIAIARQTQLACALGRHRLKTGSFPETIDALVPEFVTSLTPDPMTGAPMHYRRNDDGGFDLWSVGLNRIDDGGKPQPKGIKNEQDWVLHVPGKQ